MSKADKRALDGKIKGNGKGGGIKRDRATVKRLSVANDKAQRNKQGKIVYQSFQSTDKSHKARVEPNRKWFGMLI